MDIQKQGRNMYRQWMPVALGVLIALSISWALWYSAPRYTTQEPVERMWGSYVDNIPTELPGFEATVGAPADIVATFAAFDEPFPMYTKSAVGKAGKTLLIFLEPSAGHEAVLEGEFDESLQKFAEAAKKYSYPIILVPFNEPNLNEEVWGFGVGSNNAQNFIEAWRHVHSFFTDVPNVQFAIAYNNVSIPDIEENSPASLYPGDKYVDYVGIDGFNWQDPEWESFAEVIVPSLEALRQFNKPMYIFSVGTGEDRNGDPKLKAAWITEMFEYLKAHTEVVGLVWFNIDKERDWQVDSTPEALRAFSTGVQSFK